MTKKRQITAARMIPALLLLAVLVSACAPQGPAANATPSPDRFKGQVIRALAFEGYTSPDVVKDFEDKYGVKVESVFAYSNDEIFANLKAGGGANFDLATITSDVWKKVIDSDLVQPIDTSKLTNYASVPQKLRELPTGMKDGKTYVVPFSWGAEVLVYNKDAFPTPPDSWGAIFDEANKGKIAGWDNVNSLAITALYLGYDNPFSTEAEQLAKVKSTMCAQHALVRTYAGQISDYVNLFQSGDANLALTGGTEVVTALQDQGVKNVDFIIPKEGTLAWVDGLFVTKGAKNPELVNLLIDHMISAKPQAALFKSMGFGLANPAGYADFPAEQTAVIRKVDPDQNKDKRFVPWSEVDNYDLWTQTWNEVKAGCQ